MGQRADFCPELGSETRERGSVAVQGEESSQRTSRRRRGIPGRKKQDNSSERGGHRDSARRKRTGLGGGVRPIESTPEKEAHEQRLWSARTGKEKTRDRQGRTIEGAVGKGKTQLGPKGTCRVRQVRGRGETFHLIPVALLWVRGKDDRGSWPRKKEETACWRRYKRTGDFSQEAREQKRLNRWWGMKGTSQGDVPVGTPKVPPRGRKIL